MQPGAATAPSSNYNPTRYLTRTKYFSRAELIQNSPSLRDGISETKEVAYRKTCAGLIADVTQRLKLPHWVTWSASIFCSRYYTLRSYARTDRFYLASASILLASKVEECPRSLLDVARACWEHRIMVSKKADQPELRQKLQSQSFMAEFQEHLLLAERALLYTLGFNLEVDQPVKVLNKLMHEVGFGKNFRSHDAPPHVRQIVQTAINFMNDSAKTLLPLQYPSTMLVTVFLHKSAKLHKHTLIGGPEGQSYADARCVPSPTARMTHTQFADIEAQIMELYDQKPGAPAPGAANTAPAITAATAAPHAAPSANGQHSAASRPGVPGPAASSATQPTAAASVAAVSMAAVSCSAAGPRDSPEEGELPSSSQQQQQPAGVSAVVGHSNGAAHALPRAEGSGRYDNAQHEACSAHQAIANGSSAAAHANGHHANGHSSGHCSAEAEKPGADADASVLLTGKKRKFEDEGDGCNHMGAERKRLESEGVCAATAVTAQ